MRNVPSRALPWLAAAALTACAASESSPPITTSSVDGKLEVASFGAAPTSVDAIDETGARSHGAVGADGSFRLALPKGHTYQLLVVGPRGEEPIVFPREGAKLDRAFHVTSGAAKLDLGQVRHLDRAPTLPMTRANAKVTCEEGEHSDGDGECEDGKDTKTGAACIDPDDGPQAAADKPMAVPEHNPPGDVSGCKDDGDGEEDDD